MIFRAKKIRVKINRMEKIAKSLNSFQLFSTLAILSTFLKISIT